MNYIHTLRVIAARSVLNGIIHGSIDKEKARLAICDEEFTYINNHIKPYFIGFTPTAIDNGVLGYIKEEYLLLLDIKTNSTRKIPLPELINWIQLYGGEALLLSMTKKMYYLGENDDNIREIENCPVLHKVKYDLTIISPEIIIIPRSNRIIKRENTRCYIDVEGCYFHSTANLVEVGISSTEYITIEGESFDTIETEFQNGKLYFSSSQYHYYGTPSSINKIERKPRDGCIDNNGCYYNSDDYCCYVITDNGIIKIEKVIEYGCVIISQADSGIRIFSTKLGMYVGFIPNQYWYEYDDDTIENVAINSFANGYFFVTIEYEDGSCIESKYTHEGELLSNNICDQESIIHPLSLVPLSFHRCLDFV